MKLLSIIGLLAFATLSKGEYIIDIVLHDDPTNVYSLVIVEGQATTKDYDTYIDYPVKFNQNGDISKSDRIGIGVCVVVTNFSVSNEIVDITFTVTKTTIIGKTRIAVGDNKWVEIPQTQVISFNRFISLKLDEWMLSGFSPTHNANVSLVSKDRKIIPRSDGFRIRKKE